MSTDERPPSSTPRWKSHLFNRLISMPLVGSRVATMLPRQHGTAMQGTVVAKTPTHPSANPAYLDSLARPSSPSTPPTGPTSRTTDAETHADAVNHTCDLVERHRITIPVGATGDNVAVARLHAEAYARARGFEISAGSMGVVQAVGGKDAGFLGVTFDVVVGKGDIHLDQRVPGVLDRWTWSARAQHWASLLRRVFPANGGRVMARPEGGGGHRDPDARRVVR